MGKQGFGETTLEDAQIFNDADVKRKRETQDNVNKGLSLEYAQDSPHGKTLFEMMQGVVDESICQVMMFKHNPELPLRQNYDNILALILDHKAIIRLKMKHLEILNTKDASLKRMREVSNQIKPKGRNGA